MICIFDKFATDFSGNGIGPLCPSSCEVSETLNGEYELKMEHPLDELGKWTRIESGRILRVPVPSATTPKLTQDIKQSQTVTTTVPVYKVNTSRDPLRLRSGTGTNYKILGKYKKGTQVIVTSTSNPSWYEVTCPDGKRGYMSSTYLTFVKNKTVTTEKPLPDLHEVIEGKQMRDQPFRIYRVVPELDKITVYGRHIFYDLLDNMIKSYKPGKAVIGSAVVNGISSSCLSEHDFTFYSDIDNAADAEALEDDANTVDFININPVDALIGDDGVCHIYGGELARDWFDVYMVKRVGLDSGVQIREGKNLLGINYDVDDTNVITRIMPTGEDKDGNLLYLPETYIDSEHVDDYPNPKWYHLVVNDCKENAKATKDNPQKTKTQCYTQMRSAAQKEFDNGCDLPTVTLTVDFINCAETEEYRQYGFLQNIYIGDGVRVITKRLGVAVTLRMTEYTFDCLQRKYTKMTLGTAADGLEGNTISPRQIPAGSISGSKIAINSVGIGQLQDGSVGSLQIQDAAIGNTHIHHAAIEQAHIAEAAITYAHIAQACIDALTSGSLSAVTAKIQDLDAGDIQTDTLAAALATFVVLTAGTATFDAATIQHLVANALNLEFGVGDDVFIKLSADGIVGPKTWSALVTGTTVAEQPAATGFIQPVDYKQGDSRWGSKMYSSHGDKSQTMKNSACGPTSMADIVATWVDKTITPFDLAQLSMKWGDRTYSSGTAWSFFRHIQEHYKFKTMMQTTNLATLKTCLDSGGYAVASMGPGYWTSGGHFICLWKYDSTYIYANDPASTSRKKQKLSQFVKERKQYFCFYK